MVRDGRSAAFEAMYDRHHRAILSFCRHMLGTVEEAEDAVQHTFLAAYNDLISSRKPIQLRPWLFTIARNRCYSILRSRREHPLEELGEPATEGLAAQVQRRQDLRDLVGDLRRLPDDQRAALVLSEMDALTHEQISDVLGVHKEKVKALVFQARESLVASRDARETSCSEIREQLANLRGGALRRANLRRHLRECAGCRDFRTEIDRQRRQLKLLLPVVPAIGLKETVLGATIGGGTGAGFGGGLLAGGLFKTGALKSVVGAILAGVGAAGTYVVVRDVDSGGGPFAGLPKLVEKAPFTPARAASSSSSSRLGSSPFSAAYGRHGRGRGGATFVALTTGRAALGGSGGSGVRNGQRVAGHSLSHYGRPASSSPTAYHRATPPASPAPAPAKTVVPGPWDTGSRVSDGRYGSSGSGGSYSGTSGSSGSGSGNSGTTTTGQGQGSTGAWGSGSGSGSGGSGSGNGGSGSGVGGTYAGTGGSGSGSGGTGSGSGGTGSGSGATGSGSGGTGSGSGGTGSGGSGAGSSGSGSGNGGGYSPGNGGGGHGGGHGGGGHGSGN